MFVLNDKLYFWVLKPTASVYGAIFPVQMRTGINNVFTNLAFPIRFVSSLLQFKFDKAFKEVGAFAMNTTFGVGGLVKISDHIDPLKDLSPEDLGQTLAHYGVGDGFYIVWPLLGPSTLRDTSGSIGEYFLDPINYIDKWQIRLALKGESTVNYTSLHIGDYEDLKEASIDPYEALKDFYTQYRRHLTRDRE
jgi:phospholipid-binding lipoprotein MlaA